MNEDDRTIAAGKQEVVVSDEEGNLCLVVLAVLISKSVEVAGLVQLVLEHVALADTLI